MKIEVKYVRQVNPLGTVDGKDWVVYPRNVA